MKGECLSCGLPHAVASDLIGWIDENQSHCYWKKQPETPAEIKQALAVLNGQELDCHRYAGRDPAMMKRISYSGHCDFPVTFRSKVDSLVVGPRFLLLDDRPSLLARILRMFTRKTSVV